MTNGEKIKEIFPNIDNRLDAKTGIMIVKWPDDKTTAIMCSDEWLNAEYKEPTPKNDLGVDCIPRIEVIDYLCKHCPDDGECFKDCDEIKHLRQMPSVTPQEPRWILVSEKLPEEHICDDGYHEPSKSVLVQMKSGAMHTARYWSRYDKKWLDLNYPTTDEVIAWMSLPEPYSEVEE